MKNGGPERDQIEAKFKAAIDRLTKEYGHLLAPLRFDEAFVIIGALQLAMRHPETPPKSARMIKDFIGAIQEAVSKEPILAEIIEFGFNPAFDVEPKAARRSLEFPDLGPKWERGNVRSERRQRPFEEAIREAFEEVLQQALAEIRQQNESGEGAKPINSWAILDFENGQSARLQLECEPPTIPTIPSLN